MLIRKADRRVYHVAPGADFPAYSTGLGLLETQLLRLYDTRCSVHLARPPSILWTSFAPDVEEPCHSCQISPNQPWRWRRLCPQSLPQLDPVSYSKFIGCSKEFKKGKLLGCSKDFPHQSLVVDSVTAFPGWAFRHIIYLSVLLRRTGCSSTTDLYVIYTPCTKSEY